MAEEAMIRVMRGSARWKGAGSRGRRQRELLHAPRHIRETPEEFPPSGGGGMSSAKRHNVERMLVQQYTTGMVSAWMSVLPP